PPNHTPPRHTHSLADAVEFAHDQGILHRDLKPSNIIIDRNDVPKIADFGLAKHLDPDEDCSFESSLGAVIGTPSYMSPEQAAPRRYPVGPGSDVYSLGAILYELLTGQPPFKDESPVGTLLLVLNQDLIPPSEINPHCDRDLEAICLKCLEKRPEERYACCEELALDFDRFLEGERVHARRLSYLQKLWFWVRGMPLVAYATGRNPAYATTTQRRTQWAMIAGLLLGLGACLAAPRVIEQAYLRRIELGVAEVAGEYDRIGHLLAASLLPDGAEVVNTRGSLDSRDKLLRREVDLCILQDNTVSFTDIAIVAPLYREAVLIIVRRGSDMDQARDLADRAIALGDPTSGCRATSEQILDNLGITTQAPFRNHAWTDLARNESLEGAIVTVSPRDSRLTELLATGQFRMVPLEHDELPERFRPHRFSAADLPDGAAVGAEGLAAATAEAVLVVRKTAPASFVRTCLEQIYEADNGELSAAILDPVHAAAWSEGRLLHPAAREFFKKNLGRSR
ncbi:MAG: serine/threonine-protein kinase, partial [Planctomycetota bacterium]